MATNWECQDCGEVKFGGDPGICMSCGGDDFTDMDEGSIAPQDPNQEAENGPPPAR